MPLKSPTYYRIHLFCDAILGSSCRSIVVLSSRSSSASTPFARLPATVIEIPFLRLVCKCEGFACCALFMSVFQPRIYAEGFVTSERARKKRASIVKSGFIAHNCDHEDVLELTTADLSIQPQPPLQKQQHFKHIFDEHLDARTAQTSASEEGVVSWRRFQKNRR